MIKFDIITNKSNDKSYGGSIAQTPVIEIIVKSTRLIRLL